MWKANITPDNSALMCSYIVDLCFSLVNQLGCNVSLILYSFSFLLSLYYYQIVV